MKRPTTAVGASKVRAKPNRSILSFFKRVEVVKEGDGGLFFKDDSRVERDNYTPEDAGDFDDLFEDPEGSERFNEDSSSIKRRKLGSGTETGEEQGGGLFVSPVKPGNDGLGYPKAGCSPPPPLLDFGESVVREGESRGGLSESVGSAIESKKPKRVVGPFLEDSDSEEEHDALYEPTGGFAKPCNPTENLELAVIEPGISDKAPLDAPEMTRVYKPSLIPIEASAHEGEEFPDAENIEDYDGEYAAGEEMMERWWMEEQQKLEMVEDGTDPDFIDDFSDEDSKMLDLERVTGDGENAAACPICCVSLEGIADAVSFE
jgi:hypothetical protein